MAYVSGGGLVVVRMVVVSFIAVTSVDYTIPAIPACSAHPCMASQSGSCC